MASIEIKNYELEIENERGRGLKRGDGEDAEGASRQVQQSVQVIPA
jgi:hypothetical protein